jgi:hypothetical protein
MCQPAVTTDLHQSLEITTWKWLRQEAKRGATVGGFGVKTVLYKNKPSSVMFH